MSNKVTIKQTELNNELVKAVEERNPDRVLLLLNKGANPNTVNHDGIAIIYIALMNRGVEIADILLRRGAKADFHPWVDYLEKVNKDEDNVFSVLAKAWDYELNAVIKFIINNRNFLNDEMERIYLLFDACFNSNKIMIEYMVEVKGVDVNSKDDNGRTALHIAADMCDPDIIELLVTLGADINIQNSNGNTPLHIAVIEESSDNFKFLYGLGADIDVKNNEGSTAIDLAVKCNQIEIVNYLKNAGVTM